MLLALLTAIGEIEDYRELDLDNSAHWFNGYFEIEKMGALIDLAQGLTVINVEGCEYVVRADCAQLRQLKTKGIIYSLDSFCTN